ncbi:MAG: hypothetical protein L6275_04395 [Candidatus Portnoybacteria bacterium]|nr:hypothetical protein [Candidatus Portnoybacteria bacterium]
MKKIFGFEQFIRGNKTKMKLILLATIFALFLNFVSLTAGCFWTLLAAFLFYRWDSRILAGSVLLCLASCPFLLMFKKDDIAEIMAIYAYYFLVMTVVLQIAEYRKEGKNEINN